MCSEKYDEKLKAEKQNLDVSSSSVFAVCWFQICSLTSLKGKTGRGEGGAQGQWSAHCAFFTIGFRLI